MSPKADTAPAPAAHLHEKLWRWALLIVAAIVIAAIAWQAAGRLAERRAAAASAAIEPLPFRQLPAAEMTTPVVVFGGDLVREDGKIVLEGETQLAAGESRRFLVPESQLPLQLQVFDGAFSIVKTGAAPVKLGLQTGEITLAGPALPAGSATYKLFPVDGDGEWTKVKPLVIIITAVRGDSEIELLPPPVEKPEA